MKRFFCTVCQVVVRVQQLPDNVANPEAEDVMQRTGSCDRHRRNLSRAEHLRSVFRTSEPIRQQPGRDRR